MKKIIIPIVVFILLVAGCRTCMKGCSPTDKAIVQSQPTSTSDTNAIPPKNNTSLIPNATNDNVTKWSYTEEEDPLDGGKRIIATVIADSPVTFDMPYGESQFQLSIRKWKSSTEVYIYCTSCQFLTGFMDDKTYRIRFDEEPPIRVLAQGSTSGGSDVVFLGSEQKIIKKLKTARKLVIEPEFYNTGFVPITFSVEGLKW
ncbi:MAG TPA: hypothetical protein PLS07_00705 [Niabella sp.]|nr:hypothetical protein [Niabella sp.]HQW14272.1 hypothetical protein [Niabella sp.]HQX18448.1 hypothetical protein [Niabella sp.]HQX40060.1 hypothetical protein [Niabella sp.]HRB05975.1 hypothetical protein [Niabella sp.]